MLFRSCYFLAPQAAGWYAVVAGAWFVGAVVLAGVSGASACLQRVPGDTPLALAAGTLGTFLAWFAQAL